MSVSVVQSSPFRAASRTGSQPRLNWARLVGLIGVVGVSSLFWWGGFVGVSSVAAAWLSPPAQFDHEPRGHYEVRYRVAAMFEFYCGTNHPKVGGCAVLEGGNCYITIREELGRADRAEVLRHEKGHCNGWPANHASVGTRIASAASR